MKLIQTIIIITLLSLLTACGGEYLVKTANTLSSASSLKISLKDAGELLDISQETYQDNKTNFDKTEQRLINRGFTRIQAAKTEINALYQSRGIDTAINYARFIQTWSQAREGYQLIRSVLRTHEGVSEPHQLLIRQSHEKVKYLDDLVDQLTPESQSIDYQSIATIISATASIVNSVKPILSN